MTFEDLRPQLLSLAYRTLGTRADAEDVVQEAFLRWQAIDQSSVRSMQSYLQAVVARLALDALKSARRKRENYVGTWLPEPAALDPGPEAKVAMADSLSVAFLHVLESLSPDERIAFVMREVFGEDYALVAEVLETNEANCRQLVSRARLQIQAKRPRYSVDPEQHRAVLHEFLTACAKGDKTTLVGMLREDAVLYSDGGGKAAAALNPVYGPDRIARFFIGVRNKQGADSSAETVVVGGLPSVMIRAKGDADSLLSLDLDPEGHIRGIYIIRNPDKLLTL